MKSFLFAVYLLLGLTALPAFLRRANPRCVLPSSASFTPCAGFPSAGAHQHRGAGRRHRGTGSNAGGASRPALAAQHEFVLRQLEELLAKTNVQAVATFTTTFDHRRVVEACAPRGIHVMMEKPLAVNMEHARAMAAGRQKGRHSSARQLRDDLVSRQSGGVQIGRGTACDRRLAQARGS